MNKIDTKFELPSNSELIKEYNKLSKQKKLIVDKIEIVKNQMLEKGIAHHVYSTNPRQTISIVQLKNKIEKIKDPNKKAWVKRLFKSVTNETFIKYFRIVENINFKK